MTYAALMTALTASAERVIAAALVAPVPPAPEWPLQTVLGHLADVDTEVWHARVLLMLDAQRAGASPPTFPSWEPNGAATDERYRGLTVTEAAAILREARARLVEELAALTDEQWLAGARHSAWGNIDIPALLDHALAHDDEHTPR